MEVTAREALDSVHGAHEIGGEESADGPYHLHREEHKRDHDEHERACRDEDWSLGGEPTHPARQAALEGAGSSAKTAPRAMGIKSP